MGIPPSFTALTALQTFPAYFFSIYRNKKKRNVQSVYVIKFSKAW
jgi:hypothetical protein